ncbi:MAG: glycosyltransferase [Pirellulaceae bacterium]|nr:glycosyltransferase [Pirellulaceae bacterium]
MPTISVLMPVYNTAKYLAAAIESVRQQSFTDWELFCVDDGSSDESLDIIRDYVALDSRIRLVACPHRGIVDTLNHGVELCRSEFVARLDADDISLPNRFQIQLSYLRNHPNVAVVAGAYETIDGQGRVWKSQGDAQTSEAVRVALQNCNCIAHSSVMIRREILDQFQGPYRSFFPFAEDYDLWLRIAAQHEIVNGGDSVLQYRRELKATRPERIVQQTLSTLAAQVSNRCLNAAISDPAPQWSGVDVPMLLNLGLSKSAVHASLRRALLSEARLARKAGFHAQSDRLLEFCSNYQPEHDGLLTHIDYLWRIARVRFQRSTRDRLSNAAPHT